MPDPKAPAPAPAPASRDTEGSDIAKAPAAAIGTAMPDAEIKQTAVGDDLGDKIDALFTRHFADTTLANHTPLWNAAKAFAAAVKNLVTKPEQA